MLYIWIIRDRTGSKIIRTSPYLFSENYIIQEIESHTTAFGSHIYTGYDYSSLRLRTPAVLTELHRQKRIDILSIVIISQSSFSICLFNIIYQCSYLARVFYLHVFLFYSFLLRRYRFTSIFFIYYPSN